MQQKLPGGKPGPEGFPKPAGKPGPHKSKANPYLGLAAEKDPDREGNWYYCKKTDEVVWWDRVDPFWSERIPHSVSRYEGGDLVFEEVYTWKEWVRLGKTLDTWTAGGSVSAQAMLALYRQTVTVDKTFEGRDPTDYTAGKPMVHPYGTTEAMYTNEDINKWGSFRKDFIPKENVKNLWKDNYQNLYYPVKGENAYSKLTHASGMFIVKDNFPADQFYYMMLSSWTFGNGYENYFFGPKSKVSEQLAQSTFMDRAVEAWQKNPSSHHYISNGPTPTNGYNEFYKDGYKKHGTYKTVSHSIGSAHIMYEYDPGTRVLRMEVFNVMNVGSGTGANAGKKVNKGIKKYMPGADFIFGKEDPVDMGRNVGYPRVENLKGDQPFTNISQTIIVEREL